MKNRVDDKLSEIFDVELVKTDKPLHELAVEAKQKDIDSLEKQREYVKNNMVALIEKGKIALENLGEIAISTEKGRDFEVFFGALKTMTEINKELLDVEVVHKNLTASSGTAQSAEVINNQQIVFNGSTEELQAFLKSQKSQNQ